MCDEPAVDLDGDHPLRGFAQRAGQRAETGADLQDGLVTAHVRGCHNLSDDVGIDQEMLAERFAGGWPTGRHAILCGQDLACSSCRANVWRKVRYTSISSLSSSTRSFENEGPGEVVAKRCASFGPMCC